jgi:phage N-6-adenine-methyltransferase
MSTKMKVHFSSETDDWATPQKTFDELNAEFGPFELDVCASEENAKCQDFFSIQDDGLSMGWSGPTYTPQGTVSGIHTPACWMNPPYGRGIGAWIKKAYEESQKGCLVCCLLPARTDTAWFHDYCTKGEIRFLRGRLKFGGATNSAPFPSMVVVFRPGGQK